ncbi:MAG: oxidoreductase [Betaproteobacteria bacterium RIFCSPHIGHO2_12_FULL_69_13]|nr:MAG: oxidoreductase [Betaproteobacteria bacterium RIFCSPHIGHO2_12_FULL_69_13]OGA68585.1 MAG: oxidoreductase [Betaproteobacteria bacterium RIFCSPLOWO2_12_FULL_68_20]
MTTRREWLQRMAGTGGMLALDPRAVLAQAGKAKLITRAIPSTGERLPIVGLGSSATFAQVARSEDVTALRAVLGRMAELGGTVFDTAPAYGASEEVAGRIAQDLGIAKRLFWATKLNVARGGAADAAAARSQLETSFRRIGKPAIDLIQVHNMGDLRTQLPLLREYKEKGRVRYIGVTTTFEGQYAELVQTMRNEPIDFIGTDYAIDERHAEETILPLARDKGIAVLVYAPFGRTRLWRRVAGRKVPDWAGELDASSWAQFFLKYVASHPAVTAITPATSRPANMADNMGGATGRLPDAAMRKRMIELVEALP